MNWRSMAGTLLLAAGLVACSSEGDPGEKTLLCEEGLVACGSACADTTSDPLHCGACGNACDPGMSCAAGTCVEICPAGQTACDGGCHDLTRSGRHCGGCGNACDPGDACVEGSCAPVCPEGQALCGEGCYDLSTSSENCGSCGNGCSPGEICAAGSCTAADCPAGQTACDGACHDLQTSRFHCGGCGIACDADEACLDGACTTSCAPGLSDCGGTCRNLGTDRENCGGCGIACGAEELCIDGSCQVVCGAGLTGCDGACRDTKTDPANCGACGSACSADQLCIDGVCTASCGSFASALCDGSCTNTDFDPLNCGACGNACAPGEVCSAGACAGVCSPELATCDGACTSLDHDPANCGACDVACAGAPNGAAVCLGGACTVVCANGFGDCNADLGASGGDGCETHLATDVANCGVCGNACPSLANATTACVSGACTLAACAQGFDDCDLDPSNGCEAELASDESNCGGCGIFCAPGQMCDGSACVDIPGEGCATAWPLTAGTHTIAWQATSLDHILAAPTCSSSSSYHPVGADLIFSYTAPVSGTALFRVEKPASNLWHMVAWDGLCGEPSAQVACASEFTNPYIELQIAIVQGATYYIGIVDSDSGTAPLSNPLPIEVFEVDASNPPPGEMCTNPIVLTGGTQTIPWTALGREYITTRPSCGSSYDPTGPDLVFSYTPSFSGTVELSIDKPASNRWHLLVGTGTCGDLSSPIACVSEFTAPTIGGTLAVTAGTTYYLYLVDSTSGTAPLSNPLTVNLQEYDCPNLAPAVTLSPAHGGSATTLRPSFEIRSNYRFTQGVGTITLTGNLGTTRTLTLPAPEVTYSADGLSMFIDGIRFQPGEQVSITWSGLTDAVCGATIPPPASWNVLIPVPACAPGLDGTVGVNLTRSPFGLVGTLTEYYMAVDHDPNGWVYIGGTSTLYRRPKNGGMPQDVAALAGLTSSHLGYTMVIDGPNIYTVDDTTSTTASTPRVYRISADGGQTWSVEQAATFLQAPNDDLLSAAAWGGRIYLLTEEFSAGTELWSFDPSGGLPAVASLDLTFGGADYQYCLGLSLDSTYLYTACRLERDNSLYAILRVDRTTGTVTELSTSMPGNITNMEVIAHDYSGDGIADVIYAKGDREHGYFICDIHSSAPYEVVHYDYGTGTTNYGLAFDPVANHLWAWDDDTLELIRIH